MQQSTVSKTSSLNNCCLPCWENLTRTWQRSFFLPWEGCVWSPRGSPHLCSPLRIRAPLRSAKDPSAGAPSALPKPAGRCWASPRHCPSWWHRSEGSRCHPGSGHRDRVATGSETQRKEGRHWQLPVLQLIWLQKSSLGWVSVCSPLVALGHPCEVWAGFGVADIADISDISPDKGRRAAGAGAAGSYRNHKSICQ